MAKHKCLNDRRDLDTVRSRIEKRTDERLLLGIRKACGLERTNWFNRGSFYHRWFLRQLYAEAHERKLDVPKFDWRTT